MLLYLANALSSLVVCLLSVTTACPHTKATFLRCIHCYVVKDDRPELETSKIKDILKQLAASGTLYLTLSGGEILTRRDFFEIAENARKLHFALRLLTNGTLIDVEVADRIAALNPESVQVSIYGVQPEVHDGITTVSGSLARAIKAAKMLRERKVKLRIGNVLMKQNIDDYPMKSTTCPRCCDHKS